MKVKIRQYIKKLYLPFPNFRKGKGIWSSKKFKNRIILMLVEKNQRKTKINLIWLRKSRRYRICYSVPGENRRRLDLSSKMYKKEETTASKLVGAVMKQKLGISSTKALRRKKCLTLATHILRK